MEKEGTIDPKAILFLIPSINDFLPADGGPVDGSEFVLGKDDWRQLEFVHSSHGKMVEEELVAVCRIYNEHSQGFGFNDMHVRSRIVEPIPGALLPADALAGLSLGPVRPLCFNDHAERIDGGFACALSSDWTLYGAVTNGCIGTLAFEPGRGALAETNAVAFEAFARKYGLLLVDWCGCAVGRPGDDVFREILARSFYEAGSG
jgi:hypothetical protein